MIPAWIGLPVGFALGSIPVGYLVAKARGVDIFSVGSGNVGATNVMRALGKGPGLMVFFLDILKGLIPSLGVRLLGGSQEWAFAAGMAAIVGHSFSPFLGFRGGKGIATGLGMLLGSTPLVAMAAFAVFFLGMAATLIVSVSSILAGLSVAVFGYLLGDSNGLVVAYVGLGLYILFRHRANVHRLRQGVEPKFGKKDDGSELKPRLVAAGLALTLAALVIWLRVLR